MSATTTARHIFTPVWVPALPTHLMRPWAWLYRRKSGRGGMFIFGGGAMMALLLIIGPLLVMLWLIKVIYGTICWLAWCNLVMSVWLFVAIPAYAASIIVRTYDYLRNR